MSLTVKGVFILKISFQKPENGNIEEIVLIIQNNLGEVNLRNRI